MGVRVRFVGLLVVLVVLVGVLGVVAVPVFAGVGGARWSVSAVSRPTVFRPGGDVGGDGFVVLVTNTGGAASSGTVTVTDELPADLEPTAGAMGEDELGKTVGTVGHDFSGSCGGDGEEGKVSCSYSGVVQPDDTLILMFPVKVVAGVPGSVVNVVRVSGGGVGGAVMETPTVVSDSPAGFGISPGGSASALSTVQAGAHPDLTVSTAFNTETLTGATVGNLKDTTFDLPPGFAGDLVDTSACSSVDFLREECPLATQVGVTAIDLDMKNAAHRELEPVYNLAPEPGEAGKLGFWADTFHYEGDVKVREPGEPGSPPPGTPEEPYAEPYGIQTTFYDATAGPVEIDNVSLSVWGVPASPVHDALRWQPNTGGRENGHFGASSDATQAPYLSNPTSCEAGPLVSAFKVTSWQEPSEAQSPPPTLMEFGPMIGCDALVMEPALTAEASTDKASAPTGLDVETRVPQTYSNPNGVATPTLAKEVVTLPVGMTVNPSSGVGLGACSEAQYAEEGTQYVAGQGCPVQSKIATVRISTPSLAEEVSGSVYLAQPAPRGEPSENPFNSLVAVYLIARASNRGVLVKAPGLVQLNEATGQLTTTFDNLPPLPFSVATFSFNQGANAPLVTPPTCGTYEVTAALTPQSNLEQTLTPLIPPFLITNAFNGGACPNGTPPFSPEVAAGSENNDAGAYSPLEIRIARNDGEQEITGFSTSLPPGLTGDLNGIPFCSETQIQTARQATGIQEETKPSCPAESQIGTSVADAGVGTLLAQAPGRIYLGGEFEGAPFSVVSITSAHVGPFDLGTVIVHLPLDINPETAAVSIPQGAADQIPHIIKGVVIHLREIHVTINREHFMINPTNCNPLSFTTTVTGSGTNFTNPNDDQPVTLTEPFQVTNCATLGFTPKFAVSTAGHASKAGGASLLFKVTYPAGAVGSQSWFSEAKFDIPKQLPARLTTLQKACLAATFQSDRGACPAASIIGHALVHTPILPVPLEGPVYFVSYGGAKFPDAVMVLKGYGVTIELHGETFINKKTGVTSATFRSLPDVPFESIEVNVPTGPFSEFGANLPAKDNYNFCGQKLKLPILFKAANGAEIHQNTPVTITGCPKKHKKKKPKKAHKASHHNTHTSKHSH
jgi:hypothetical protein